MKRLFWAAGAVLLASCAAHADEDTYQQWWLMADRQPAMPAAEALCLVAGDDGQTMTVVGKESTVEGVGTVSFEERAMSNVRDAVANVSDTQMMYARKVLTVMGVSKNATLKVFDAQGRLSLFAPVGAGRSEINVSSLAPGVYIAEILGKNFKFTKK